MTFHARWRGLTDDRGSVTVEAALVLSVLVVVCALIVGTIATVSAHLLATHAAGAAARAHAIGAEFRPARGTVQITESEGLATATVTVPAVFGDAEARAVFPVEYRAEYRVQP